MKNDGTVLILSILALVIKANPSSQTTFIKLAQETKADP